MYTESISTLHVHAVPGHEEQVGITLRRLIDRVATLDQCLHYEVVKCRLAADVWIVSSHWQTRAAMEAHFNDPSLNPLLELLGERAVRKISFDSFYRQQDTPDGSRASAWA
ncbi:MAG: putative quinol monooxygenase [Janthinobacterium lividum]